MAGPKLKKNDASLIPLLNKYLEGLEHSVADIKDNLRNVARVSVSGNLSASTGNHTTITAGAVSFSGVTSGTDVNQTLHVGDGSVLDALGTGIVNSTEINGVKIPSANAGTAGKIPITQGDGTAAWADPLVQGLQADNTLISNLNPVLVGGKGDDGNLHSIAVDNTGHINVVGTVSASFPSSLTVTQSNAANLLATVSFPAAQHTIVDSGSISVSNFPATQSVSGTVTAIQANASNLLVTPVQLNASNLLSTVTFSAPQHTIVDSGTISVSNFPATQPVSGTVAVSNFPATQPVSGTVTANAGTGTFNTSDTNANTQGSTTSGQKGFLELGAVTTAAPVYTTAQSSPLSLNTAGGLRVDGSGVTQPISGSVTATQATAASLNATVVFPSAQHTIVDSGSISVSNFPATQPVSGTVTANIGTTNGLALDTSVNGILVAQGSTTSGEKGPLVQGAVTTAAPSYTTAQTSPLSLTTGGALRIDGSATTQPISGTVTANAGTGTFAVSAVSLPLPSGASTSAKQPALGTAGTASADVLTVQGIASMTALKVDGSGVTQPVSGTVTAVQANAANLLVTPVQLNASNLLSTVTFSAPQHTIVDSGSVTANQSNAANLLVTAIQSNASNLLSTVTFSAPQHVIVDSTANPQVQGTQANGNSVTGINPVLISGSDDTLNRSLKVDSYGRLLLPAQSLLGDIITGKRSNQIEVNFSQASFDNNAVTNSNSGTASAATQANGEGIYATGTGATGDCSGVSVQSLLYRPGAVAYSYFTAAFTTPTDATNSNFQRIGPFTTTNGFFIGYEKTTFKATVRNASSDTGTAQASFNGDTLSGQAGSRFTRAGVIEAIDWTKLNVFRIRWSWFGAAPILFEVLSPDSTWVTFHTVRQPNTSQTPSIVQSNLSFSIDVSKTSSDSTNLKIYTGCWAAGMTSPEIRITDTVLDSSLAPLTRAVIAGHTTAAGGSYVNVKVTPAGAVATAPGTPVTQSPASPSNASVGVTSAQVVASNTNRTGLVIVNLSSNTVSFGLGATAVLNNGISLTQNGTWVMDAFTFTTGAVNAIASGASSTISIQEFS